MSRIKICGITTIGDALAACDAGAAALGFIAVPASKRFIDPEQYRAIAAALPPFIAAVIVGETIADTLIYEPVWTQYYAGSDEAPPGVRKIRALRPRTVDDLDEVRRHEGSVDAFLLDAYHPEMLGGTGVQSDWNLFKEAAKRTHRPLILSGGG